MNKKLSVFLAVFISVCVTSLVWLGLWSATSAGNTSGKSDFDDIISKIDPYIDKYSIYELDEDKALSNAVNAYLYGLDGERYSAYYTAEEYKERMSDYAGAFTGIGIQVFTPTGTLAEGMRIERVFGGSPAESAGMKAEDRIIAVDGTDVRGKTSDEILDVLLGDEGESVTVTVRRGYDDAAVEITYTVVRESFTRTAVDYEMLDGNIGLIRIYEFKTNALSEFETALNALVDGGARGLIFDVRENPGGDLDTVCDMVDLLVDDEVIAVLNSTTDEQVITGKVGCIAADLPKAVLINGNSASASELFSSALRDILGVRLVGNKSYGKGTGQTTYPLSDGSALKISTFSYVTKSRVTYNGIGLVPDYDIDAAWDTDRYTVFSVAQADDSQLQKAIEVLFN